MATTTLELHTMGFSCKPCTLGRSSLFIWVLQAREECQVVYARKFGCQSPGLQVVLPSRFGGTVHGQIGGAQRWGSES